MTETKLDLRARTGGTEITRFNALRHGVLSHYTVLPWENPEDITPSSRRWWPSMGHRGRPRSILSRS